MKKLLILGAGQYGIAVKELAEALGCYAAIDFLDDRAPFAVGSLSDAERLLGACGEAACEEVAYDEAVVAIGNPTLRAQWLERIPHKATLIHPNAHISPSAVIGEGSVIEAGASVCAGARVGRGCIVMAGAAVGHNAVLGDICQVKYNATVVENATVPSETKLDCNEVFR